jgi:hypothetical protein
MSKLLINEPPLQVLPTLARLIGLNEAIVLQQIHYWLSAPNSGKEINGRRWVRNSTSQWHEQNFPFWSLNTVRRAFNRLIVMGLLEVANHNQSGFNRTQWYSLNYDLLASIAEWNVPFTQLEHIHVPKMGKWTCSDWAHALAQNGHFDPPKMDTSLIRETTSEKTAEKTTEKKRLGQPRTSFTPQDWQQVLTELRGQMSQATFDANLRGTQLSGRQGNCLTLQTPSALAAERLNQQLRPLIERALADYTGCPYQIQVQIASSQGQPARPPA